MIVQLVVLKVILTPVLVGVASLGARRWGPAAGGWIVSLPLTSGPVAFFLAVQSGPAFGAATAEASMAGCVAIALYASAYARAVLWAPARGWPMALAAGAVGWLAGALFVQPVLHWPVGLLFIPVVAIALLALRTMPSADAAETTTGRGPWEVPLRMALGTAIVLVVTAAAPLLGSGPAGIVAMLPIVVTILAVFAHRGGGPEHGIAVQRGLLSGLVGTACFLGVVAAALPAWGVGAAFLAAMIAVLAVQVVALRLLRGSVAGGLAIAGGEVPGG